MQKADKFEENAASWAKKILTRIMERMITPLVDMFKSNPQSELKPKFELKPQVIAEMTIVPVTLHPEARVGPFGFRGLLI